MITLFVITTVIFMIAYVVFEVSISILWQVFKLLVIILGIKAVIDLFKKKDIFNG